MTEIGGPKHEPINIGAEANPPFFVAPDPAALFKRRAARLATLAPGHGLEGYLGLVQRIAQAQDMLAGALPMPEQRSAAELARAREGGMPPLEAPGRALIADTSFRATLRGLVTAVKEGEGWPAAARLAAEQLGGLDDGALERAIVALDSGTVPQADIALHVLLAAALQVHYARRATQFGEGDLTPIADGVCPACGAPPLASTIVGWPKAQNARYCTCSLCAAQWNVVRVKCTICGSTGGIGYSAIEGQPDTVKAETCDACRSYVKIFWQVKDASLEPLADDIATLALDMKVAETGYVRRGVNPFLIGYGGGRAVEADTARPEQPEPEQS